MLNIITILLVIIILVVYHKCFLAKVFRSNISFPMKISLFPGGKIPKQSTAGAVGLDVYPRAVVSSCKMSEDNPVLRETLFDFERWPEDPEIKRHIVEIKVDGHGKQLAYRLYPGESVLVGIGFCVEMDIPTFCWIVPRSGLLTKHGIAVLNAPSVIDSDYRGGPAALIQNQGDEPFDLHTYMRVAQIVFQFVLNPQLNVVPYNELSKTKRGAGGFGSTGIK